MRTGPRKYRGAQRRNGDTCEEQYEVTMWLEGSEQDKERRMIIIWDTIS